MPSDQGLIEMMMEDVARVGVENTARLQRVSLGFVFEIDGDGAGTGESGDGEEMRGGER